MSSAVTQKDTNAVEVEKLQQAVAGLGLQSHCQVSTGRKCDICGEGISSTQWQACVDCGTYDTCLVDCAAKAQLLSHAASHPKSQALHAALLQLRSGADGRLMSGEAYAERVDMKQLSAPINPMQPVIHSSLPSSSASSCPHHHVRKVFYHESDFAAIRAYHDKLYELIVGQKRKIEKYRDLWIVHSRMPAWPNINQPVASAIYSYLQETPIVKMLTLDGGGVRGYLTIRILLEILDRLQIDQTAFTEKFAFIAGTSTGGLIAFALNARIPLQRIKSIYQRFDEYFVRTWASWISGNWFTSKYTPDKIHAELDNLIEEFIGSKDATLGDLYSRSHAVSSASSSGLGDGKQALVITAYDVTKTKVAMFSSGYPPHQQYRLADVLKSTMAAPTYFPPHSFKFPHGESSLMIDGGMYANDPTFAVLWANNIMSRREVMTKIVSLGTGVYNTQVTSQSWGGAVEWMSGGGKIINVLLEANRSLTEKLASEMGRFSNLRRFKYNVKSEVPLDLDDARFVKMVDEDVDQKQLLRHKDFESLLHFLQHEILSD